MVYLILCLILYIIPYLGKMLGIYYIHIQESAYTKIHTFKQYIIMYIKDSFELSCHTI